MAQGSTNGIGTKLKARKRDGGLGVRSSGFRVQSFDLRILIS